MIECQNIQLYLSKKKEQVCLLLAILHFFDKDLALLGCITDFWIIFLSRKDKNLLISNHIFGIWVVILKQCPISGAKRRTKPTYWLYVVYGFRLVKHIHFSSF